MDHNSKAGLVFLVLGVANALLMARNVTGDMYHTPTALLYGVIASMLIVGALFFFRESVAHPSKS
jgi:hypothetical protein